jgi:hypothetical protein
MKTKTNDSDLFIEAGRLFYQHESGLVFTAALRDLRDAVENEQPFAIAFVAGIPEGATDYDPGESSPEGALVFEWIECMDEHIEAMARAITAAQAAASTVKTRLSVAG